jgi:hypothetical protein
LGTTEVEKKKTETKGQWSQLGFSIVSIGRPRVCRDTRELLPIKLAGISAINMFKEKQ